MLRWFLRTCRLTSNNVEKDRGEDFAANREKMPQPAKLLGGLFAEADAVNYDGALREQPQLGLRVGGLRLQLRTRLG